MLSSCCMFRVADEDTVGKNPRDVSTADVGSKDDVDVANAWSILYG